MRAGVRHAAEKCAAERRAANPLHLVNEGNKESPVRPSEIDPGLEFELDRVMAEGYGRYNRNHGFPSPEL
ncbi:uncharacterized protein N7484_000640 [Penicillium longicatenatum]|uniref:uncharacterized protein n=1 Tax=Penicillium longicatenatum TaxID=1561947 RepID=UPI0025470B97|nr:uncharacterized protein N7484_000640 [Penicillium longicatenatum]KAJ5661268.1 hypothetical protein N7484_000640 [Penicillium longicatenatum]